MPLIPDDELCVQQMLGIVDIPEDIEREYMIRARMLHRQLAGGAIGPVAIVDMLRSLDYGPPPPQVVNADGNADWRRIDPGTEVEVRISGEWVRGDCTFAGEIGGGTVAVKVKGNIDEFNSFDVRIPSGELPSDVDAESFSVEADRPVGDARLSLLNDDPSKDIEPLPKNEVEKLPVQGDIGSDDEVPPHRPATMVAGEKIDWRTVKKGSEVWLRDGDDIRDAKFLRNVNPGKAVVVVDGAEREVDRAFLKLP